MGGSQSTRNVVADDDAMVVVSDDVRRRLMGMPEGKQLDEIEAIKEQIRIEYSQRIPDKAAESNRIQAEEFSRAVQEVESKFGTHTADPVCQDLQQEVYVCYQNHLKEPLRCSDQVRAFTDAVEKARRNAIMTKQS